MSTSRPPILFYCQHLLGLGHAHRAAALTRALVKAGERVLFVAGGPPVPGLDLGDAESIGLPPLVAADAAASRLALPDGTPPPAAYLADRRARLLALLAHRDPACVLLELFPFGRHALATELAPLLLAVGDDRRRRDSAAPRVAVSLRDVVVSKANAAWYELAVLAVVCQSVDRVLVHGSPDVIPLDRTFGLADRLGARLIYTGYVGADSAPPGPGAPSGEVVVSGGGGRVAGQLFQTALAARRLCPAAAARPWRLLTGPYLPPAERAALDAEAAGLPAVAGQPAVTVETFRDDFASVLRGAALSVSQAGYNTVLDVVRSGVRAVVVPYEGSGDEQPLRARLLAARGLLVVVEERALTPAGLAAAMETALTRPDFPAPATLDLDGATRSATIVASLVDGVVAARETPP
ncbi:MAG TPA: glycosyltransferase [Methylomirabilota bacterium]|nr:glycosyltransferase [Methylomirabilota bacterium]